MKNSVLLVVDDSPDLLIFLSRLLEQDGYTILTADSGTAALEHVKTSAVNLVISDVVMPNGDGVWLLTSLRDHGFTIPVILITAGSNLSRKEAIRLGAAELFKKPIDIDLLEAAIEKRLRA